jgi:hypothetical protein
LGRRQHEQPARRAAEGHRCDLLDPRHRDEELVGSDAKHLR